MSYLVATRLKCLSLSFYGGMTPPDQAHTYELYVFALDHLLDLKTGFLLNELYHEMEGHILAKSTISGIYEKNSYAKRLSVSHICT